MKKLFLLTLAMLSIAACPVEELVTGHEANDADIYASVETLNATKTSMDQYNNVLWSEGDQIVAFLKTTLASRYQIKEQYVGTRLGGFSKVTGSGSGDDLDPGYDIGHNVAVYPYSDDVWCMENGTDGHSMSYKINIVLPQKQSYVNNSFSNGAFPMVAVSSSTRFAFKNICGGVKLQLKGIDKIQSVKLEGMEDEKISGSASVVGYSDDNVPVVTMASAASSGVTLDCGDGVQLYPDLPTTFIIAVPPVEFKSGMKITVTDVDGESRTYTNPSANIVRRSTLLSFPVITYTKPAPPEPARFVRATDYAQATAEQGVYNVKIKASLVGGVCTVAPFDLACCLNIIGAAHADHRVSFEVISGMADIKNPVTAVLPLEKPINDPSVGDVTAVLERNNSLLTFNRGGYAMLKATLSDCEGTVDEAVLVLTVEDPLEFVVWDFTVSRLHSRDTRVNVCSSCSLRSTIEGHNKESNLLDMSADSLEDIIPYEYKYAYGIKISVFLEMIYQLNDYGMNESLDQSKYDWNAARGILTIYDDTGETSNTIYADVYVRFNHDFIMCSCPTMSRCRITIR